ncbi:hypothetical protein H0H92_011670 [Tricholoma furcatifolium]|nr:hypothetical protein H0H92_011670 [Tricholoma furcatifolium]
MFEALQPSYWQLLVAAAAVFNSLQNFATLKLTRRIYNVKPNTITALQARTFAAWTLTSAIVRGYAAYDIHNKTYFFNLDVYPIFVLR